MAFRIPIGDRLVEADTAADVQSLLVLMATPLPSELTPLALGQQRALPPAVKAQGAGRRRRSTAVSDRYRDDVCRALRSCPNGLRTRELEALLKVEHAHILPILKAIAAGGWITVSGATLARRWTLTAKGESIARRHAA